VTALALLPHEDEAAAEAMRQSDLTYQERHREHRRNGCLSVATRYVCKLCRSYEAGRSAALELVSELLEADPFAAEDGSRRRCRYCRAERPRAGDGNGTGHRPQCPWQAARLLLEETRERGSTGGDLTDSR
jgi:hypothetical protein